MKLRQFFVFIPCLVIILFTSCNNSDKKNNEGENQETKMPSLKVENVTYSLDTLTMNGYIVYDENKKGPRPAVLVVHEWWGLNEYARTRARQLAELGYTAMAVDMYGNGMTADNPKDAERLAGPFYMDPAMAMKRLDAAIAKLNTYGQVDTSKIAAIGYCFGGGVLLNAARLGENLDGVVSFHGNLLGTPANKDLLRAKLLVCHGLADQFVKPEELQGFKNQMDSIGANYTVKTYPNATHSFTNPNSTAMGEKFKIPIAYNAAADSASWIDMKNFLNRIFQ
jgi:dienelactone hydrolase